MVLLKERVGKLIETIGEMIYEEKIPVREYRMKKNRRKRIESGRIRCFGLGSYDESPDLGRSPGNCFDRFC